MKVTAILPDDLIADVQKYSGGKNITDSLHKALIEWVKTNKIKKLNSQLEFNPLSFKKGFNSDSVRKINRNR
ncbi:MAG: DUF2191 domain-containing protein [bacterium]|jgi:hypothetical protein